MPKHLGICYEGMASTQHISDIQQEIKLTPRQGKLRTRGVEHVSYIHKCTNKRRTRQHIRRKYKNCKHPAKQNEQALQRHMNLETLTSVKAKEHFQTSTKRGTNSKTTGRRTTHHETHHLHDLKTTKPGLDTTLPTRQRDEYLHARNGACPAQGRQRGNGVLSGNATTSNMKRGGQVVD